MVNFLDDPYLKGNRILILVEEDHVVFLGVKGLRAVKICILKCIERFSLI